MAEPGLLSRGPWGISSQKQNDASAMLGLHDVLRSIARVSARALHLPRSCKTRICSVLSDWYANGERSNRAPSKHSYRHNF